VGQLERSKRLEYTWEDNIYIISGLIFVMETSSVFVKIRASNFFSVARQPYVGLDSSFRRGFMVTHI
jgi:hypothetical protein